MTRLNYMEIRWRDLVLLAGVILLFVLHSVYLNCVAEDSFISFRYAQHLADGHGLVWNIGEAPVEGYTNFLWVLLLAVATSIGFHVAPFAQIMGIAAGVAAIIFTFRFAHIVFKLPTSYSLIPCLLLAVSGPFATWASSGMETDFFALFVLMSCYYFARYWQAQRQKFLYAAFVAILVASLTRPEGVMCFAILVGLYFAFSERGSGDSLRTMLPALLAFVVPFALYLIWRISYFGYLLPNTFYAKTGGTWYQFLRGAIYTGYFFVYFVLPLLFMVVLLLWERSPRPRIDQGRMTLRTAARQNPGVTTCASVISVYTLYVVLVGGDYMAMFRFFVPISPLIYLLLGLATSSLFFAVSDSYPKLILARGLLVFGIAAVVFQSTPAERIILHPPLFQHGQYQGVETERWHSAGLSLIGRFFRDYKHGEGESLATDAIGAIGYYSEMTVYDINGIVDPHIAHSTSNNPRMGWGLPAHEKSNLAYTFSLAPTYYMFSRDFSTQPLSYPSFGDNNLDDYVQSHYQVASVWLTDAVNHEEGYFNFLELKDKE